MGQQARGYRSILISIGDFHAQWRTNGAYASPMKKAEQAPYWTKNDE
jgi:hypothetical protein